MSGAGGGNHDLDRKGQSPTQLARAEFSVRFRV